MKKLHVILPFLLFFLGGFIAMNAQCDGNTVSFNEDDFDPLTIKADEATMVATPVTSNCIDIWDAGLASSGTDGIGDVEITMTAEIFNPNANGTCNDGDFLVSAAIGGAALPCPGPSSSSDFGGSTSDDCVCESGYACYTYTFKNGFNSTAAGLNAAVTSSNGSTEGHESMVGWVTQGTDAMGNPLALPAVNLGAMATYCTADYNGGVSTSQQIGATGPGTFAVDEPTGITNDCATSGQSGEDTESGDNPNDNTDAQTQNPNWGLAPTDIITEYTVCWIFTTAPGTDCDGDGDTGVGTNPSGSIGNITVCPVCTISNATATAVCDTADPNNAIVTVTFDAFNSSGTFNILDAGGAVVGTATGGGMGVMATFTVVGPTTATPGAIFTIEDSADPTCTFDFMVDIPECIVPCMDYTATISGGGQICNSGSVDLMVAITGGTAPYTLVLSDGTTVTGYNSGDAIPVSPTTNTTYGITSVSDADNCPGMVAGSAEVMVIISCANAGSLNGN